MDEDKQEPKKPARKPTPRAVAPEINYDKLADMVASRMAPMFSMPKPETDIQQFDVGQHDDISIDAANGGGMIQPVDGPLNKDYLDELAFMEEVIEIMVHEVDDPTAENPVQAANNGRIMLFPRGVPTKAKRCIVDSLIVKSDRVTTPEFTNDGGERLRTIKRHSALKYPFSVIHDPNPMGREWLRRRMAEK